MQISVTVMAHPKRRQQAEALYKKLSKYPFCFVAVAYDDPDASSHQQEWDNGARALMTGIDKGDWHVVVQDDAILTPNFYENIEGAINNCPGGKALISLYTGKPRPLKERVDTAVAKCRDETWLRFWLLMWGVGIVIPTSHIKPLLEFVSDRTEQYDTRIGIFYQRNRLPVYYTMPSLVDHDDDLPSLLGGHGRDINGDRRVAHRTAIGLVSWNNKVIDI